MIRFQLFENSIEINMNNGCVSYYYSDVGMEKLSGTV